MASENFTDKNAVFRKLKAKSERNRLMPSHAFNSGFVIQEKSWYSVLTSSLVENLKRLSMKEIRCKTFAEDKFVSASKTPNLVRRVLSEGI